MGGGLLLGAAVRGRDEVESVGVGEQAVGKGGERVGRRPRRGQVGGRDRDVHPGRPAWRWQRGPVQGRGQGFQVRRQPQGLRGLAVSCVTSSRVAAREGRHNAPHAICG